MTPKEKAIELFNSYEYINKHINKFDTTFHSKMCALIAVDQILEICKQSLDLDHLGYWLEVKQEIEKL